MLQLQNLNVLKLKMMEEAQIIVAYNYFFDNFGENEAFLKLGAPARNAHLEAVIGQSVGRLLGLTGAVAAKNLIIIHLPEYSFYHGACIIGGKMVNFIYFDDIKLGCIAVAVRIGNTTTQFLRFSTTTPPDQPREPSAN